MRGLPRGPNAGRRPALAAGAAAALAHGGMAHRGVPERVAADRPAGPYAVSVWARADVGMGAVYVVYRPARPGGPPFVPPAAVRVAVAPGPAGRDPDAWYVARREPTRAGAVARYVAHVAFDRPGPWRLRVVTAGAALGAAPGAVVGDVRARLAVAAPAAPGPAGALGYVAPFLLAGGLWWRAAERRAAAARGGAPAGA